jgi:hypothetical protein
MAVRIELKRSNVPGKIPSTSQLQLGEVAVNTYDGAAYFKKNVGGAESIVQLATTTGTGSGTVVSASHADYADTAGYATNAGSAATAISASYSFFASNALSSSYAITASHADNAPNAISASYARTASYSDNFNVGNNLTVVGTITAQKLVVQVITSSTEFVTGSTRFGSQLTDTHQFTGSVSITGSLSVNGIDFIQTSASFDGRINGISGSFVTSASFNSFTASTNDSLADIKNATASLYNATASIYNATASLYAFTASILNHSSSVSASVDALNTFSASILNYTASNNDNIAALYAATASLYNATASIYATTQSLSASIGSLSSSFLSVSASNSTRILALEQFSSSLDATFATDADLNALSSSFIAFTSSINSYTSSNNNNIAALYAATASLNNATSSLNSFSASVLNFTSSTNNSIADIRVATASLYAFSASINSYTASNNATITQLHNFSASILNYTASQNNLNGTFATTGSNVFRGNQTISGSLTVSGSTNINGTTNITGSVNVSGSTGNVFTANVDTIVFTGSFLQSGSANINGNITASNALIGGRDYITDSGSFSTRVFNLEQFSSSLDNTFATDADLNALSSSFIAFTSSINSYTSSNNATIAQLQNATASLYNATASLYAASASINAFTASQLVLNGTFATTGSNIFKGNQTITGSLLVSGSTNLTNLTASGLRYPTTDGLEGQTVQTDGAGNLFFNDIETIYEPIRNGEAFTLVKGTPVYVSGSQGANPIVYVADAANPAKMPVTYIVAEDLASNNVGRGILLGLITGINLTGYTAGTEVYVAAGGGWTSTRPTGSAIIQVLGIITKPGNGGQGLVLNPGPANLPNIQSGYTWVGNSNSYPTAVATSSIQNVVSSSYSTFAQTIASGLNITASNLQVTNNALIGGNLTVNGTASFNYVETITGSAVIIGQEYIILNTQTPAARYAGLLVYDSGSNSTASIVWDSLTNHWVYENATGSTYSGGGFMAGPKNTGSLDNITYPTQYRVLRGQGGDHLYDSNIYDDNNAIRLEIDTQVTGTLYAPSITGSLYGTASWASRAISASSAVYASFSISGSFAETASYWSGSIVNALSASHAETASFVKNAQTASYVLNAISASFADNANNAITASHALTASYWSGSIVNALSASFASTASYWSGSIVNALSASFADNANNATNAATASYVVLAQSASYWSGSIQNAVSASFAELARSASFATTASFALNAGSGGGGGLSALYIQDEGITQGTASYIDFTGAGVTATVLNGTASVTIPGGGGGTGGSAQTFTQSLSANTWSFAHSVNSRTPIVEVYDSTYNVIIPTAIYNPGPFQTNIYFDVSQSGYAIISTGGVLSVTGSNAVLNQNVAATTWSFNHDLHTTYPVFTIYDSNDDVIIPQRIHAVDTGSAEIYFSTPRTGKAIASVGGNVNFASQSISTVSASFAATASSADDFFVRGTITAQTLVVQVITSSQDFVTGSTKFGTISSNTHQFTGSVLVTGSLNVNGSDAILTNQTSSMSVLSSSYAATASFALNVPQTASFALSASNAVTASYIATASYALTASFALNSGGSGVGFPFSGSAVITGSLLVSQSFVDFTQASYVTGSFTGSLNGTASWANNAISASYAAVAGNSPGFTVNFTQSVAAATWSFVHNLNTRNPIVQVYDTTFKQILPNEIVATDSATVEVRFDYNQAGYAVASNGGGLYITGSTSRISQAVAATTWSFNHKLNTKYPAFEVFDSNDNVIIPAGIKAVDTDNAEIYFATPTSGIAIAEFSGINGLQDNAVSASYALYAVTASYAATATSASFASTSSYLNPITSGYVVLTQVSQSLNFVDDAAASASGVPLGGLYRNGNFIMIRLT